MPETRSSLLSPAFALVCALTFLTFFAAFQLFPTVPLRLLDLGASVEESGRFMSVFTAGSAFGATLFSFDSGIGLGSLLTAPLSGRLADRIGAGRVLKASLLLCGLLMVLVSVLLPQLSLVPTRRPAGPSRDRRGSDIGLVTPNADKVGPIARSADDLDLGQFRHPQVPASAKCSVSGSASGSAPGSASRTYHISVLPNELCLSAATSSPGCT